MPSSTDRSMVVPLRFVCARFYLFSWEKHRREFLCAASWCDNALKEDDYEEASEMIGGYWHHNIETTETSEQLRQLAFWLLCPKHKDKFSELVARVWEDRRPDDDIFHIWDLQPPDLCEWTCPKKGCEKSVKEDCIPDIHGLRKALTTMETLTPSAVIRVGLSNKERAKLVTELVGSLHCDEHRTPENTELLSNKWNNILTETIQRQKSEYSSGEEATRSNSSAGTRVSGQELDDNQPSMPPLPPLPSSEGRTRGPQSEKAVPTQPSPSSASVHAKEDAIFEKANRNVGPHQIDLKLISFIRSKKANTGKQLDRSLGDVYVFQNPEWPNHVKIGQTRGDPDDRMAAIKKKCDIECLEQVFDPARKDFRFYELVEKLCHKELKNFKKQLLCKSCKTKKGEQQTHHEWFQVRPEVAVRTVQKWRKWMSLSPYDEDGDLVPWWREKPIDGLLSEQQPNGEKETIDDHDSRHQRWSRWLERPSTRERTKFEIWRFFCDIRPKRKSLWNTTEKNPGPLLIYFIIVWFICEPRDCILLTLVLLLVLRDWA